MRKMKSFWSGLVVTVGVLAVAVFASAAEHPAEHPEEHPEEAEHPVGQAEAVVQKEDVIAAIEEYVRIDSSLKGGYFLVYDQAARKPLILSLKKIHSERVAKVGEGVYFVCADFETPKGKFYDLDFFMNRENGQWLVSQITIHKEEGKPRYTWHEENGLWKMRPIKGMEGSMPKHEGSMPR